jgi:hypothetical protein
MKSLFLIVIAGIILPFVLYSQSPVIETTIVAAGGQSTDVSNSIAIDAHGNRIITGYFHGTAQFGAVTLISNGGDDAFIAKINPQGKFLWVKQLGGVENDYGRDITTDKQGNIIATGGFQGLVQFGESKLQAQGGSDVFIVKMNAQGNILWARSSGGTKQDYAIAVACDAQENIHVAGSFEGTVYLGDTLNSQGRGDIFYGSWSPQGEYLQAHSIGGIGNDKAKDIAIDDNGNIFLTGSFAHEVQFGAEKFIAEQEDIFVIKMNSKGGVLWAVQAGGKGNDEGNGLAIDKQGNCFLTGSIYGNTTFGDKHLKPEGKSDTFVAKINQHGVWVWAKNLQGESWDEGVDITLAEHGGCFVTGYFYDALRCGDITLFSAGKSDIFTAEISSHGEWLAASRSGGVGKDYGYGITSMNGQCIITGAFSSVADFSTPFLAQERFSFGRSDIFVSSMTLLPAPTLLSPSNNAQHLAPEDVLRWRNALVETTKTSTPTSYHIEIASDADFTQTVAQKNTTSTSATIAHLARTALNEQAELLNSKPLYWRVRSQTFHDTSNWSDVWRFSLELYKAPPTPSSFAAIHQADDHKTSTTLSWKQVEQAEQYEVQIASDTSFKTNVESISVDMNNKKILQTTIDSMDFHETRFWRVRAKNIGGVSPWSDRQAFTTLLPQRRYLLEKNIIDNTPPYVWTSQEGMASHLHIFPAIPQNTYCVDLHDARGQLLWRYSAEGKHHVSINSRWSIPLPIEKLPQGMYSLSVTENLRTVVLSYVVE